MNVAKTRPAESVGAAGGLAGLVAAFASRNWLACGVAVVGFLPAMVTYFVENGGLRGVLRSLWRGKS